MQRKRTSLLAYLLTALLLVSLFPATALGGTQSGTALKAAAPVSTGTDSPSSGESASLEKAIQTVRQLLDVPDGLTRFSSSFSSDQNRQIWNLLWNPAEGEENGSFNVCVDAKTDEILSFNSWQENNSGQTKMPSLSVAQARKIGQDLLNRLHPDKTAFLSLDTNSASASIDYSGSSTCSLHWQRMYKDLPVAGDGANMTVDLCSGMITYFDLSWTPQSLPEPGNQISQKQAEKVFIDNGMLQLQYIFPYQEKSSGQQQGDVKPLLVYSLEHASNGVIDAATGKPIVPASGQTNIGGMGGREKMMQDSGTSMSSVPLTPEEIKEIESTAKLLTQDQAIQAVKERITVPDSMALESADLYGSYSWLDAGQRNWQLVFRSQNSAKTAHEYLSARVNASTGELISFSRSYPEETEGTPTINQAAAQQLAEKFLKSLQPQHFQDLKHDGIKSPIKPLILSEDAAAVLKGQPTSYNFHYYRVVNGVVCPSNGVDVCVNAVNQEITSYNLDWTQAVFPSTQGVLGDKAYDSYFKAAPLKLTYLMMSDSSGKASGFKLVYQPQPQTDMYYIDAKSGAALNSQGQPVSQRMNTGNFDDIAGNFAENEITLLGQAGIFREYGNSFHPNENVTAVSLLRAMLSAKQGSNTVKDMSDQQIIKRCQQLGWVRGELEPSVTVNREMLANLMVRYLQLDYLTKNADIFKVPYLDASTMNTALKASSTLTWGLGIIKADGQYFNAGHIVSRAEAAAALAHTLAAGAQLL